MTVPKYSATLTTILVLIAVFLGGCMVGAKFFGNHSAVRVINSDPALEEFQAITGAFVSTWMEGDATACANTFAEDAIYMVPGEPTLFGRADIERSLREIFVARGDREVLSMAEPATEVITFQDWAVIRGTGEETFEDTDSTVVTESYKWMVVASKNEDGKWEAVWDIYNMN